MTSKHFHISATSINIHSDGLGLDRIKTKAFATGARTAWGASGLFATVIRLNFYGNAFITLVIIIIDNIC